MLLRLTWFSGLLLLLIIPSGLALFPQQTQAAAFGLVPCALQNDDPATSWKENEPCTLCHLLLGMQRIVTLIRNIMTAIAIAVIVAMAIIYITSAGNESQISFAKEGIKYSLIGFVVILLAWLVVNFIFTLPLFEQNGLVRTDWDSFSCNATSKVNTGSSVASSARGIGNASGDSGTRGPGRGENPGAGTTPPRSEGPPGTTPPGSAVCDNGVCESGESCSTCSSDCGTCPPGLGDKPVCGSLHDTCDIGVFVPPNREGPDRWIWACQNEQGILQETCQQLKEGCGDADIDPGEECDNGLTKNSLSCSAGGTCTGECKLRDCSGVIAAPPGCGPSNGGPNAPSEPLCVGAGVIASSVTPSHVGNAFTRYDWTCTKDAWTRWECASGDLNANGDPIATCGPAVGVPSAVAPSSGLCSSGHLHGTVGSSVNSRTGLPEWGWTCHFDGSPSTQCRAPDTSANANGNCTLGDYSWTVGGYTCTFTHGGFFNGQSTLFNVSNSNHQGDGTVQYLKGSITLLCTNGVVSQAPTPPAPAPTCAPI